MVSFKILAGGYTSSIVTYLFDSDAATLTVGPQSTSGSSPSWLTLGAKDQSVLYATNELSPVGALEAFKINDDGSVTSTDSISSQGNGPAFTVQLSTGEVVGPNYGSNTVVFAPTSADDPTKFQQDAAYKVELPTDEGVTNHPHQAYEYNDEVFIPDLGADTIWRLKRGDDGKYIRWGRIDHDKGSGPRHIAIKDDILFTVHELNSYLTAQAIPDATETSSPFIANVSVVPTENVAEGSKFAAAELIITESTDEFPESLIYVSNRNIGQIANPTDPGDTIAIFRFNSNGPTSGSPSGSASGASSAAPTQSNAAERRAGFDLRHRMVKSRRQEGGDSALELLAQIPTGLQQVRGLAIGSTASGTDKYVVAGANTAGGVAVFERTEGGANLKEVARNTDIASATSFVVV
ncbi:Lactonase, 7-bladed beta-propeller-domain-containing protein [Schizophyllum commune]